MLVIFLVASWIAPFVYQTRSCRMQIQATDSPPLRMMLASGAIDVVDQSELLSSEDWSCRGTTFCFGRTSLLDSPVACAIHSVTHFSCSNFLPLSLNGRDLPHSQCSPTVVLYFSLYQQAQWGQTRGNFSTSAALTRSESKHFPYRINPLIIIWWSWRCVLKFHFGITQ